MSDSRPTDATPQPPAKPIDAKPITMADFEDFDRWLARARWRAAQKADRSRPMQGAVVRHDEAAGWPSEEPLTATLEVVPGFCEHCGTSGGCSVCGRLG